MKPYKVQNKGVQLNGDTTQPTRMFDDFPVVRTFENFRPLKVHLESNNNNLYDYDIYLRT